MPHDVVEGIRPRIARLTRDLAFRGRVDLHGDSFLSGGMVRVRWLHGGAQRDPDQMLTEVTAIVARSSSGMDQTPIRRRPGRGDD